MDLVSCLNINYCVLDQIRIAWRKRLTSNNLLFIYYPSSNARGENLSCFIRVIEMTVFSSWVAFLVFVAGLVMRTDSHPQCLDYGPPFKIEQALSFCPSYSKYGCCSQQRDTHITSRFRRIISSFRLGNQTKCAKMLRDVLCLECHPYAAHIFASEGNAEFNISSATPGLCDRFCRRLFRACSNIIRNYFWREGKWISKNQTTATLNKNPRINRRQFCHSVRLPDQDYCYPNVQNIDKIILGRKYNQETNEGCVCAELVASSLRNPLAAMHAGDGTNRLFVAEQLGEVQVYLANGTRLSEPFLDIKEKVLTTSSYADERGFLGLAFHPNYSSNGRVFVYYSAEIKSEGKPDEEWLFYEHKSVLSEYRVSAENPNRVDPASEKVLLEVDQPEDNHNGGQLLFGIDGYLYLSLGDGGAAGDPFGDIGNGLSRSTLLGSIIRIDVNTKDGSPYKIPPDNPFVNTTGMRPEIYAYGARNMWRCSIDRGDKETQEGRGRMFCGDVGQNRFEEIDIITKGGNYGWRAYEGYSCYDKELCKGKLAAEAIPPIFTYPHSVGKSVVGGYVYRGCRNPNLYGKYIFADTWSGEVFYLTEDKTRRRWNVGVLCLGDSKYCTDGLVGKIPRYILSFGEDEQGELYMLATNIPVTDNNKGKIYRLVDPARRGNPNECKNAWFPSPLLRPKPKPKRGCADKWEKSKYSRLHPCVRYKRKGYCHKYKDFMKKTCAKTCNLCLY